MSDPSVRNQVQLGAGKIAAAQCLQHHPTDTPATPQDTAFGFGSTLSV